MATGLEKVGFYSNPRKNAMPKNVQTMVLLLLLLSHFSRVRLCATPEMAAHQDRKSTRLNSSHSGQSRMPSSA